MFDELNKYKESDHFFYKPRAVLSEVCNAPSDKCGVFVVYALKNGRIELVYIGSAGKIKKDGSVSTGKTGSGNLRNIIINGKQGNMIPRRVWWAKQMIKEKIEALDVYWYVTHNDKYADDPERVQAVLLRTYWQIYGTFPRWNAE